MNSHPLFTLENLGFSYGSQAALQDINLKIQRGRFYGIIGPNGCGKTTLLDILTGSKLPVTGTVKFKETLVQNIPKKALAQELALVPQDFDTGFGFTVEETVLMGRHPHVKRFHSPSPKDWDMVDWAIDAISIEELRHRYINTLSGGQKQRVIVARALAQDTPVLLFDEATSSLDIQYTLQIFNLARKLIDSSGKSVIAVIHNLNLAAAYCDDLVIMQEGKIHSEGPTHETLTAHAIREIFGVQAKVSWNDFNRVNQVSFMYREEGQQP